MIPSVESQLEFWVTVRRWGEQMLIWGLEAELIIIAVFEWKFGDIPDAALLKNRKLVANILAALLVIGGVGLEFVAGHRADLFVDLMRFEQEKRVAQAQKNLAKTETLIGGELRLYKAPNLQELTRYAGTHVFVQTTSPRIQQMLKQFEDLPDWIAAERFADSFKSLQSYTHWNYERVPDDQNTRVHTGVTLLTWQRRRSYRGEIRAYEAARALRCLLVNDLGIVPKHFEVTTLPEYPGLPHDAVLIQVGVIDPKQELRQQVLMRNDCSKFPDK